MIEFWPRLKWNRCPVTQLAPRVTQVTLAIHTLHQKFARSNSWGTSCCVCIFSCCLPAATSGIEEVLALCADYNGLLWPPLAKSDHCVFDGAAIVQVPTESFSQKMLSAFWKRLDKPANNPIGKMFQSVWWGLRSQSLLYSFHFISNSAREVVVWTKDSRVWELSVINNLWPSPLQNEAYPMETRLAESKLHKFEPQTESWPPRASNWCKEEYKLPFSNSVFV